MSKKEYQNKSSCDSSLGENGFLELLVQLKDLFGIGMLKKKLQELLPSSEIPYSLKNEVISIICTHIKADVNDIMNPRKRNANKAEAMMFFCVAMYNIFEYKYEIIAQSLGGKAVTVRKYLWEYNKLDANNKFDSLKISRYKEIEIKLKTLKLNKSNTVPSLKSLSVNPAASFQHS